MGYRASIGAYLGVVLAEFPGFDAQFVPRVGVGLVADLDPREPRAEDRVGARNLTGGALWFIVREADGEQDRPAARLRQPAQPVKVGRVDRVARPFGLWVLRVCPRGPRVG